MYSIYGDQSGILWVGTGGGLNKLVLSDAEGFDRERDRFVTCPGNIGHLSNIKIPQMPDAGGGFFCYNEYNQRGGNGEKIDEDSAS
jgi:hypothetical protein